MASFWVLDLDFLHWCSAKRTLPCGLFLFYFFFSSYFLPVLLDQNGFGLVQDAAWPPTVCWCHGSLSRHRHRGMPQTVDEGGLEKGKKKRVTRGVDHASLRASTTRRVQVEALTSLSV